MYINYMTRFAVGMICFAVYTVILIQATALGASAAAESWDSQSLPLDAMFDFLAAWGGHIFRSPEAVLLWAGSWLGSMSILHTMDRMDRDARLAA